MEIYKITNNLNGMIYIGQTRRTVAERVKQHLYQQSKIGKAMTKYGTENFSIDVIDHADTQEELDSLERFWIAFYNSCENGYNTLSGGKPTKKEWKQMSKMGLLSHKKKKYKKRKAKAEKQSVEKPKVDTDVNDVDAPTKQKHKEIYDEYIKYLGDKFNIPYPASGIFSESQIRLMCLGVKNYKRYYGMPI